jgi:tetratricopeptide (TPR) repeat protein
MFSLTRTSQGNFRHIAPAEVFPSALESVTIALALDESLPEAHAAMGWLALSYEFDWRKAEKAFRRAIELAPSNFIGNQGLSFALQAGGRLDEALAASKRAFELDPLNLWPRSGLSEVYFKQHDYDATLSTRRKACPQRPGNTACAPPASLVKTRISSFILPSCMHCSVKGQRPGNSLRMPWRNAIRCSCHRAP